MIIKSALQKQWNIVYPEKANLELVSKALVDNSWWYTVKCSKEASAWIREQDESKWYNHIDGNWYVAADTFDVDQETYIMLKLQWSEK
jgi:hypothetical protein